MYISAPYLISPICACKVFPPSDVGSVDIFLSHSWGNPWGLLVAAAVDFVNTLIDGTSEFRLGNSPGLHEVHRRFSALAGVRGGGGKLRLWIDILAVCQHPCEGQSRDLAFEKVISKPYLILSACSTLAA